MSLFTDEERLQMMREHDQRERAEQVRKHAELVANQPFLYQPRTPAQWEVRATPKTRAEKCESDRRVLLEIVRDNEFPGATVAELAEAASRSQSWVRRTLKAAGVTLQKGKP
jgi:hypothetical protein